MTESMCFWKKTNQASSTMINNKTNEPKIPIGTLETSTAFKLKFHHPKWMPTWTDALNPMVVGKQTIHATMNVIQLPHLAKLQVHTQLCMAWNIQHLQVINNIDHSSQCNNSDCILFQNTIRTWHQKRMKPFQPNNTIQQHQGLDYYLAKAFKTI
jgi:hypothetical protein